MSLERLLQVKSALNKSWVDLVFTKKDGNIRSMRCTTNFDFIPEEFRPKPKPIEEVKDESFEVEVKEDPNPVINVFEQDKGWRSFRLNQLNMFNGETFSD